jgi:hypothetical protein
MKKPQPAGIERYIMKAHAPVPVSGSPKLTSICQKIIGRKAMIEPIRNRMRYVFFFSFMDLASFRKK